MLGFFQAMLEKSIELYSMPNFVKQNLIFVGLTNEDSKMCETHFRVEHCSTSRMRKCYEKEANASFS
jgi:hypothetical protein